MAVVSLTRTRREKMLLHYAGMALQDIFNTLPSLSSLASGSSRSVFEETILILDKHFKYEPNYDLGKQFLLASESTAPFIHHSSQHTELCKFSNDEEHVVEQLVERSGEQWLISLITGRKTT